MIYKHVKFKDTYTEISAYNSSDSINEYHMIIHIENREFRFEEQVDELQKTYLHIIQNELIGVIPVFKRYYLSDAANQEEILKSEIKDNTKCACSIVEQPLLDGSKVALWVYLMNDVSCKKIAHGLYEASHASYRHLWLAGAFNRASKAEYQMRLIFNDYIVQLMEQKLTLANNCLRTWIYVQDVDNNYAGVVKARNEVFVTQNLTPETHFIASTGIAGRSSDPTINVLFDAYSVDGIIPEQIKYLHARTHLNPTHEYGVSFERGTVIEYGDRKHIFISGTASINNRGEIEHPGNIKKQVERMWENVSALLKEADADFSDMGQFTVYLRDIADYGIVKKMFDERFPHIPKVITLAPVCRPGWLVEMECIGVKSFKSEYPTF